MLIALSLAEVSFSHKGCDSLVDYSNRKTGVTIDSQLIEIDSAESGFVPACDSTRGVNFSLTLTLPGVNKSFTGCDTL